MQMYLMSQSRGSSVDIATRYGLDGRGSFAGRFKNFLYSTASRTALGPNCHLPKGYWWLFPWSKAAGA
jgi:hypothetical protein